MDRRTDGRTDVDSKTVHMLSQSHGKNVAIANALQLEAARYRASPYPLYSNSSPVPSLKSLSLSIAVLERFADDTLCYAVTLTLTL